MPEYQSSNLFEQEVEQTPCQHIIRVAFESAADAEFDYFVPDEIWPIRVGQRVEVPFGRKDKSEVGFCTQSDVPSEVSFIARGTGRKLKRVTGIVNKEPLLDSELMELARWISGYYVCPLGQVLAAMVPSAVKRGAGAKTQKYVYLAVSSRKSEVGSQKSEVRSQIICPLSSVLCLLSSN